MSIIHSVTGNAPKHYLAVYQQPTPANLALHAAAKGGDAPGCLRALKDGACPNFYGGEGGVTAVHLAAKNRAVDALKAIVDYERTTDDEAFVPLLEVLSTVLKATSLHFAAEGGSVECAKYLIAKGHDVEARDAYGHTPLMVACAKNDVECVRILLKSASAMTRSKKRETPLHVAVAGVLAATRGAVEEEDKAFDVLNLLIKDGADVNAQDVKGSTPLHCVVSMRPDDDTALALCKLLIKAGANVKLRDEQKKRPSDLLAGRSVLPDVLKLLQQHERYIT